MLKELVKMLKSQIRITLTLLTAVSAMILPTFSSASGVNVKVGPDGKTYTVERSTDQRMTVDCNGLQVRVLAQHLKDRDVSIMATIIVKDGAKTRAFRLLDEINDQLNDSHTLENIELGCLSGDGGAGLVIQSTMDNEAAHIQLDRYGRVFTNFDQTGFELQK